MNIRTLILSLLTTAATGVLAGAALADPPERVGRIAYVDGDVSFQPPQQDEWTYATRNFPVADGEAFWTGDDGRAELQIGSVEARLDNETELDILDVQYGEMRLALPQGSLDVRLWSSVEGGVTVSTPAGDVRLDQGGVYRVDVGAQPDDGSYPLVEVTVFQGEAGAPGPGGLVAVGAGQAALVYAGYEPQFQDADDAAIDDWSRDRESQDQWRPHDDIPLALTGFEDLDGAGDFVSDPDYGDVWYPRDVPTDWAPYRYGRWSYVEPWGYTWIDDQSWGFAPFHYGRWAQINGRWGWLPGRRSQAPVYAPALVAFIGGSGWGVGEESVGWIPLGPDEIYQPPYEVSENYARHVNASNVRAEALVNITINRQGAPPTRYRNAAAATVVRASAISGSVPVQRAAVPVTAAMIASAPSAVGAHARVLPPPMPAARAGTVSAAGAGRGPATPPRAAPPPARLQSVRAAVVAAPAHATRPPVIAGARIAPPSPRPPAGAPPRMVAPAQIKAPAMQSRRAVVTPSQPAATPTPAAQPRPPSTPAQNLEAQRAAAAKAADAASAQAEAERAAQARAATQTQAAREAQAAAQQAQAAREQAAAQAQAARQAQAAAQAQAARAQAQSQAAQARAAQQAQAAAAAKAQADAKAHAQQKANKPDNPSDPNAPKP